MRKFVAGAPLVGIRFALTLGGRDQPRPEVKYGNRERIFLSHTADAVSYGSERAAGEIAPPP